MQKVLLINEMDYEIPDIQGYMAGDEDYPVTDLGILRGKMRFSQAAECPLQVQGPEP